MARWLFSFNVPLVMNNFFYVIALLITFFGVATGIYAAKQMKKAEKYIPADPKFEAAQAAKNAK